MDRATLHVINVSSRPVKLHLVLGLCFSPLFGRWPCLRPEIQIGLHTLFYSLVLMYTWIQGGVWLCSKSISIQDRMVHAHCPPSEWGHMGGHISSRFTSNYSFTKCTTTTCQLFFFCICRSVPSLPLIFHPAWLICIITIRRFGPCPQNTSSGFSLCKISIVRF